MIEPNAEGIAIIGLTGRFPGAANVDEFWRNLVAGVESISTFTDEELAASGLDVVALKKEPGYVAARGILPNADWFDAAFFGMNPKEAEVTDPQQRLFLEAAWEALEQAGYHAEKFQGAIGVYAGTGNNTYYLNNLHTRRDLVDLVGGMVAMMGNEKDYLATRVAYKMNLKGPAINVNTACSTSLVAVCQACQSLLNFQCDLALAGGVSVTFPQRRGYHYQEGGITSPDGHCRAFDAQAQGTVSSDGLGIVVLKRLAEALQDGDQIYAVIKGTGLNNDGSAKVSFTSPSVDGHTEVIALAQAQSGFDPATISYIEAHGTGTPLGDPIEIAGLTQAFGPQAKKKFCAIGSVKSNIGHLDTAAGVAGLIKTVLALKNKMLPPSLHFTQPNPRIDFANSPFFVNPALTEWLAGPTPRRAGVSSFGLGGTNAHVVLEEAPALPPSGSARDSQLLVWSARTAAALDVVTANLAAHLKANPELNLADAAFTLQLGRADFNHRRMLVCRDIGDAVQALATPDLKRVLTQQQELNDPPVVFMFPGQGVQYVNMGADLYRTEPVFAAEVDLCAKILQPHLGLDLRSVLFPQPEQLKAAKELLAQTRITQPALFVTEYALAKLWLSWGIKPRAMIGHSVGEYVAACLAGVFTLETVLELVAGRARLVQSQPGGAMLAVRLSQKEVLLLLRDGLWLAAVNSPTVSVLAGSYEAIDRLERQLSEQGVAGRRLQTSHAFHSGMMDPVIAPFTEALQKVTLREPTIPYVSNVTARWITREQAVDPKYWAGHVRQTVRFADGLSELFKDSQMILLEVGPGQTLSTLARQHPARSPGQAVVSSFSAAKDPQLEVSAMLGALGKLWLAGVKVDWAGCHAHQKRRRVPLPTYPFERKRFWAEPGGRAAVQPMAAPVTEKSFPVLTSAAPAEKNTSSVAPTRKERLQEIVISQLQELSGRNRADIVPTHNFLEMGFDSLFLAQASQAFHKTIGIKVTFRQLLEEFPTPSDLAGYFDRQLPPETVSAIPAAPAIATLSARPNSFNATLETIREQLQAIERQVASLCQAGPAEPAKIATAKPASNGAVHLELENKIAEVVVLPLSEAQMELWLAAQWGQDASRAFNQVVTLRLRGLLRSAELRDTLQTLVHRHDALRTTFLPDGSGQKIAPTGKLEFLAVDLSGLNSLEQEMRLAEVTRAEDETAFDLTQGPLVRARLIKFSETDHVLLLTTHHLIMDGWSIGVIVRELSGLYSAKVRGTEETWEPAMQYREYLQWQNAPGNQADFAQAQAYWLKQFENPPTPVELPPDHSRPAGQSYRADCASLTLSPATHQSLKAAAAQQGVTVFTYLLASFNVWLYRLSGQEDLAVGVPVAGQIAAGNSGTPGARALVGHCVNLLPVRSQCVGSQVFTEYLQVVKRLMLDASDHQNFTFGNLVKQLNLPRDSSRMPLLSLTFNVIRALNGLHLEALESEFSLASKGFNLFDLSVDVVDTETELRLECRFNTDLFESATMQRWLGHWQTLLEGMASQPECAIAALPILNATERQKLLLDWNNTETSFPRDQCLPQLFEAQARHNPDAVAVVFEGQSLTYHALNQRANRLAHYLKAQGVGAETLVAVCLERSIELVVGLLAILKAGGAYVPLDPNYPAERIEFILQDAQATVLLTEASLAKQLPNGTRKNETAAAPRVICLDPELSVIGQQNETNLPSQTTQANLAYVLYTSGSTGKPKGVQISHAALVNFLGSMSRQPGLGATDILLAVTTLSFDIAGLELWLPLLAGARVVIARSDTVREGKRLAAQLTQCGATVIQATPATWRMLLEAGWEGNPRLKILCGGEAWAEDLAQALLPKCASLWNMYGPTETTIWSAASRVAAGQPPMIGAPIANTQFYVLDGRLQPVPLGVAGELHIGGEGLARGYLNRPELTAEKFVADPFRSGTGARLYKTGDLVRYRGEGRLEFLSRMDQQVKIRGFRIELGEIEASLRRHANVREAVVAARPGQAGEKRLVAYVVARQQPAPTAAELQRLAAEHLPDYMVPTVFMILDALPLTPNGKVDRKSLPEPEAQIETNEFVPPVTAAEIAMAKLWCEVLALKQVGLHDNFFLLGGHSLVATQLISRLEKFHGVEVTLREIFDSPTVAEMSKWLESKASKPSSPAMPSLVPLERKHSRLRPVVATSA